MTDRARLRSFNRVTVKGIEFEVHRLSLNERIAAQEAAKAYEGHAAYNEVLMRETIARMVYLDGEPLGADAGTMDIEFLFALAPHVVETQTEPMIPPAPEPPPAPAGANGAEEPAPKSAS
jgi:hypothetical protein